MENESLSSTPVHGSALWSNYIGSGRLAFAGGYNYKMKIEYSGVIPPGTIKEINAFATVSNVVQSGRIFTFNLKTPETTPRLETLQIGYFKSGTALLYAVNWEVVRRNQFYNLSNCIHRAGVRGKDCIRCSFKGNRCCC